MRKIQHVANLVQYLQTPAVGAIIIIYGLKISGSVTLSPLAGWIFCPSTLAWWQLCIPVCQMWLRTSALC